MNQFKDKNLMNDFLEFMNVSLVQPPREINEIVSTNISRDLNPNPWSVFSKLALVQAVVGFATLLFCPQFGYTPTGNHGIMHFFMQFGDIACMAACGGLFVGTSFLFAALVMRAPEVRVLRNHSFLQASLLSLLVVGTFLCLGAEVVETLTLAWIAGSIIAGISTLELGWMFRQWFRSRIIYG